MIRLKIKISSIKPEDVQIEITINVVTHKFENRCEMTTQDSSPVQC